MSAPLVVPVPEGATVEQLDPPTPSIGVELRDVIVELLRVGDFTTYSGYRLVTDIETVTETRGRGSKRATLVIGYRVHHNGDPVGVLFQPGSVFKRVFARGR